MLSSSFGEAKWAERAKGWNKRARAGFFEFLEREGLLSL